MKKIDGKSSEKFLTSNHCAFCGCKTTYIEKKEEKWIDCVVWHNLVICKECIEDGEKIAMLISKFILEQTHFKKGTLSSKLKEFMLKIENKAAMTLLDVTEQNKKK